MDWPPPKSWPLATHSRRVAVAPHRWHVQSIGAGPDMLVLHGAGGATHSWRALAPLLQGRFRLHLIDLPGHGFTQSGSASRAGLQAMTADMLALMRHEGWQPRAILGHSAGMAVGLNMALALQRETGSAPACLGINPALAPFDGVAGWLFPVMARMLALNPLVPALFSLSSSDAQARKVIEGTGSRLTPEGYALYTRLMGNRRHVNGALQMMARWDLDPLLKALPEIAAPVRFVTGAKDTAVLHKVAEDAAARMPDANVVKLDGLGHLAHEEDPEKVAAALAPAFDAVMNAARVVS